MYFVYFVVLFSPFVYFVVLCSQLEHWEGFMVVQRDDSWSAARATSIGWAEANGAGPGRIDEGGRYIAPVIGFADRVVRLCRDTYGREPTPLFVDALDPETAEPFRYEHTFRGQPGGVLCNVGYQQYWLRTLAGLSAATGNPVYAKEAEESMTYFLARLAHPQSGLFPWGGHIYYNLSTREVVGYQHELKAVFPFYELMWRVNPEATRRFIESFYHAHIEEWSTMVFNRHGHLDGGLIPGALSFLNTGSDLILAGVFLYTQTAEQKYLDWAWRLAKCYDDARNPKTGLGPYMFTVRSDNLANRLFGPGFSELNIVPYAYRFTYFDFILLYVSTILGDAPQARDFRQWSVRDLKSYSQYGYDRRSEGFYTMLCTRTGRRLTPRDFKDPEARYFSRPHHYEKRNLATLARLLRSYVFAHQLAQDPQLLETARLIVRLMDLGSPAPRAEVVANGESAASAIQGLIDLFATTGDEQDLNLARRVADDAVAKLSRNDLLMRAEADTVCWINQRLPLALIRLQCVEEGTGGAIPPDLGGTIRPTSVK